MGYRASTELGILGNEGGDDVRAVGGHDSESVRHPVGAMKVRVWRQGGLHSSGKYPGLARAWRGLQLTVNDRKHFYNWQSRRVEFWPCIS